MVLADTILLRMTDRKIGTASSVKACNAFVGGRPGYLPPKSAMYNWIPFVYLFCSSKTLDFLHLDFSHLGNLFDMQSCIVMHSSRRLAKPANSANIINIVSASKSPHTASFFSLLSIDMDH